MILHWEATLVAALLSAGFATCRISRDYLGTIKSERARATA